MKGKNVLVIGASSGLGRAIALRLAQQEANVIVSSRSVEALENLKQDIENAGGSCHVHPCNINVEHEVQALIADTIKHFAAIDVAYLCSGVQYIDPVEQLVTSEVETMFQTNVIGIIRCARYLLPHMIQQKNGQMVFISSIMAQAAFPQMVSYGATKAAISCFARGLQREVSTKGVYVTLASPGHMSTKLSAHLQERIPHWYGKSGSLDIDTVAKKIITAVIKKRPEVVIGSQNKRLATLIRLSPSIANTIIGKITT
jgi:short-subunit dehydrogenase